jgi:cytochrome b
MPRPPTDEPRPPPTPVRVWDLPTRIFHWTLAAAVVFSIVSAHLEALAWHFRSGYLIFGLLAFRIVWGLVGGRWSRFSSFLHGPGTLLRYLRGRLPADEIADIGHSPLGALSVFGLLAILLVQVGTGLVADDEISTTGPLNRFVKNSTGLAATGWHKGFGQWIVIGLAVLHVVAVGVYLARGRNLVRPMIGGDKALPAGTPASADDARTRLGAAVVAAAAAAVVAWIVSLGG